MRKKLGWIVLITLLLAVGSVIFWLANPSAPMPEAVELLKSSALVQVEQGEWLVFRPIQAQPETGLIFYPGAKVEPAAYAPFAQAIAEQGYLVVITPMPFNLAVFSPDKAAEVIQAFPEVSAWAIGGHSLGGSIACMFAFDNPGLVQGLVLWASYPASGQNLVDSGLKVVSIAGSRDSLSTPAKVKESLALLPADTRYVEIEGGNHAQFGWYGAQAGDSTAEISREAQQDQVVNKTVDLLALIGR